MEQLGNLNAEALVARLLQLRGIHTEAQDAFFHPDLDDLHDPLLMLGMEQAVDRLVLAQRGESASWPTGTTTWMGPRPSP